MSLKGFFRWYIYYADMILVHIKTRLDLLAIQQTSRWDQKLGQQYSNLNRHVSTQEKQSQRQYSTSSCMVLQRLPYNPVTLGNFIQYCSLHVSLFELGVDEGNLLIMGVER